MYARLGIIIIMVAVVWLTIKLLRSPWYDKFFKDLKSGKLDLDTTAKDTMKDISKAEVTLGKQVDQNIKEAEKLKAESEGIKDFLGKRGTENKKKEDS